jgi:formylglycine-generating enzyme required for sulfatase activity/class 3 adenylate cyclase
MIAERVQRRLVAILSADVVGYSRLMAADETGTLARLRNLRAETVDPAITEYRGRIVKEMGDGLLVEFASAADAVECAVAFQHGVVEREADAAQAARIRYRIGINLGDVVIEGSDIFGNGVNIAARLQGLAAPDGINISAAVYDQIRAKLDLACEDIGEHVVKNIDEPVRIYRVLSYVGAGSASLAQAEQNYRAAVAARFAEDAAFYVPLAGKAAEASPEPRARAPRSARRFGQRARVNYSELVPVGEELRQVPLDDLRTAAEKYPCVILLGDPGCGKSTALEALAFDCAGRAERLPVLLRLSHFSLGSSLDDFLRQGLGGAANAGHWGAPQLAANLRHYLEEGKLLLLLDALNEMPQEGYRERCQALRAFIDAWSAKANRFVVTCRALDYGEELSGLRRVEVQPLSDAQIRQFLMNELPDTWRALWTALTVEGGEQRLLALARNPYLLTVMIDVFETGGELSRNRAELMRRFTEIMLEWAKTKYSPSEWLDASLQIEALSTMAYEMQARSGFGTTVKTEQIKTVMPREVQPDPNWPAIATPPDRVFDLAASANILEMPVDRATVRFYHQLLQEFFAARHLLRQDAATLAALWRAPRTEAEMPAWSRPENNFEPLPPPPPTGWEETTILAAAMSAGEVAFFETLLEANPVLAARCLLQAPMDRTEARHAVIARLLSTIADSDVALRVRIVAGTLLGELGDPRLGEMVLIPAGPFLMGEGREEHGLALTDYRIGKHPVTNAEYRRFVEAGGYAEKRWWTAAGRMEIGDKRREPRFWQDTRFNRPNQPAIGLSWYECVAYCRWLSAESGWLWRLPTEAEWEKAARGIDGRVFPWGNEFDDRRLNGRGERNRQVCTTTPVGIYPAGASPFGLLDCVGNAWEWCATRWKKAYPYDSSQDEWQDTYLEGQNLRVLRGGSWYDTADVTRTTHRFQFQPFGWNDRGGFRLVSPA